MHVDEPCFDQTKLSRIRCIQVSGTISFNTVMNPSALTNTWNSDSQIFACSTSARLKRLIARRLSNYSRANVERNCWKKLPRKQSLIFQHSQRSTILKVCLSSRSPFFFLLAIGYLYCVIIFIVVPGASPADLLKIREAINNATSLQEVERLTRILQSGQISEELLNGKTANGMDTTS